MKKIRVELAVCTTNGDDYGQWHTESVVVEFDIDDIGDINNHDLFDAAVKAIEPSDEYLVACYGLYHYEELLECSFCGEEYSSIFDELCSNPKCPQYSQ